MVRGGDVYMGTKDIVILLAIMVFFSTVNISKEQVVASASIPTVNYILANNNESNNYGLSESKYLLEYEKRMKKEAIQEQRKIDTLEKGIRALVGNDINKFGMVYYDINSKETIEINGDKQFVAASTVKVPINMLMYDMVVDKKIDINEKLKYIDSDFENGAGILQKADLIKPISIKTLSDYSIIYSDNIAINMILRKIDNENKYKFIEEIVGYPIVHEGNNITPKESSKILERLYLNPENNKYYSDMIETMKKTKCHDRIDKYIPQKIVAHKIGDFGEYINDTAIVCTDNPYILVIFTKGIPDAKNVIAKVSKLIYDSAK